MSECRYPSTALIEMLAGELGGKGWKFGVEPGIIHAHLSDEERGWAIPKARQILNQAFGIPLDDNPDHQFTRRDPEDMA